MLTGRDTNRSDLQHPPPLQGISIMIFCLIALPCIGTVTVAKREAGTWWFALAQFAGLTVMGFVTATVVYQVGLLL